MQTKLTNWTRPVVWLGAVTSISLLLLLLISLFVTYTTQHRQSARQYEEVTPLSNLSLEIIYPQELLMKAPAGLMLNLTVTDTASFTQPLLVTLDLPPGIVMSGTTPSSITFEPGMDSYQQSVLTLNNSGILTASQPQTILVSYGNDSKPVTIEVESVSAAALRYFFSGVLSDKGPLLLGITSIAPIAVLILQEYRMQREQEKEEKEKREHEEKEDREKREHVLNQILELRQQLILTNPEGVKRIWDYLDSGNISGALLQVDLDRLRKLKKLSLKEETAQSNWVQEIQQEWPAELVGALICAEESVIGNSSIYLPIFTEIPLERVTNVALRNRFIRLWRDIDPTGLQDQRQAFVIQKDALYESSPFQEMFPEMENPFTHFYAEREETTLYKKEGFYNLHAVLSMLLNSSENQIVYGVPGCGRTALAKGALHEGKPRSQEFWIYQQAKKTSAFSFNILVELLAREILNYLTQKPTLLMDLQEEQRRLIAVVLGQTFTSDYVRSFIAETRQRKLWTESVQDNQKQIWLQAGDTQLQMLSDAVESMTGTPEIPEAKKLLTTMGCFETLGFKKIRLLLDTSENGRSEIEPLIACMDSWYDAGIVTTLFMPDAVFRKNEKYMAHIQSHALMWSGDDLRNLINHRCQKIADVPNIDFFFERGAIGFFVDVKPNTPRQLARLWHTALLIDNSIKHRTNG